MATLFSEGTVAETRVSVLKRKSTLSNVFLLIPMLDCKEEDGQSNHGSWMARESIFLFRRRLIVFQCTEIIFRDFFFKFDLLGYSNTALKFRVRRSFQLFLNPSFGKAYAEESGGFRFRIFCMCVKSNTSIRSLYRKSN